MRKSWFKRLLLSYMPIFVIVITFIFFVFFQLFSEQSRQEALNANKTLSLQAMRMVDTSLKVIDNMIVLESINSKPLNDFFKSSITSDPYINIQTVQKLKEIINYYPLIDSIYLVRNSDGYVLSEATNGYISSYPDQNFIEQYQISKTPKWTGVRTFEPFKMKGSKQVVSLVRGLPYMKNDLGMIVVNVAADSLNRLTQDMLDSKVSFIQVKDASGKPLFGSPMDVPPSQVYSQYVSSYTNWKYDSGLLNSSFVSAVSYLYNLWFIVGLVMIAIGFIWMIYVSRRNSKPIEAIAARFSSYSLPVVGGGWWKGKPDEFVFIESAFDQILEQSKQYQEKYREDLHVRTRYMFRQLIEGDSSLTVSEWKAEADRLNLPQPLDQSRILIIEIDKYGDFCKNYSKVDQDLLKFTLRTVVDEIASKWDCQLWSEWTSSSNLSLMLFEERDHDRFEDTVLLRFAEQIITWTHQNLKFTITIGVGGFTEQLGDIPKSFKGAMEALKYKIVLGENRLIQSEDISSQGIAEVYTHLGEIRSIIQSFRMLKEHWSDDYEKWFEQLKKSFLTNDEIFSLMNYLIYYIGREMSGMSKEIYNRWVQEGLPKLTVKVDNSYSLEQLRHETKQVLTDHYEMMKQLQDEKQYSNIIRDICRLIERDYANPDLSLEMLGDRFHLNAKYVSKLFKENTGQRFVDFLIDIRMKEAKHLLTETDYSVQEVAERVGYAHAISFTRVFKRTTGSAPGEYRNDQKLKLTGENDSAVENG
ncbi:helix-turn-helix domain-containing protein [Paenibacillus dokdonensis]|uniref:Helix-turn-helix domain-containing protein n=1 Tax=Paenibacillus dokdonensis TaxID=2567944 RepID=A0ABU6GL60_9BACL|nr:helix-turn-helix domain-containing protein [Paenibacillus dokdonensis]MEC0240119.1 helix-turn-helix domain-containing protein [Paenibacillus dokdonensis]